MKEKKLFVLDTNVLLHDFSSIFKFEEHDVYLPIIVLEELDKFKNGHDQINYHAREVVRTIDELSDGNLFKEGVALGEGRGRLFIETGKPFSQNLKESFNERTADHRILAVVEYLKEKFPSRHVEFVTKDLNLRLKAKSLNIDSKDLEAGKVEHVDGFCSEYRVFENVDSSLIAEMYRKKSEIKIDEFNLDFEFNENQYFIFKSDKTSALVYYSSLKASVRVVEKRYSFGIKPRNSEQAFAIDALMNPEIKLISLMGKAGTGKTLLALAAALEQQHDFQQILLARPIVALSNKDLGYLPGTEKEKIGPYMLPLFDNLNVIKSQFSETSKNAIRIDEMLKDEKLLITPLAYIRGRSLSNVFFIVDEAQNLTPHEIKTIITRAGDNTKMVFTGDVQQIDSPYLDSKSNGLSYLAERMSGQDLFSHVKLFKGERSELSEIASDLL